jgi:5-methyltetrahydropteroyltriglutamate--homocysteine methyltransferase
MRRSTKRILTTHVGSLPRPADLREMWSKKTTGAQDEAALQARLRSAVKIPPSSPKLGANSALNRK